MGIIHRAVRIGSVGTVGDSYKNKNRKAQAKLAKQQAGATATRIKLGKAQTKTAKAQTHNAKRQAVWAGYQPPAVIVSAGLCDETCCERRLRRAIRATRVCHCQVKLELL